jgi:uncharacterized membrane protein HdeD (DUF308 family)
MLQLLAKNWWVLELRGALTVAFGLVALFLPGITLGALILVFGFYALVEGVLLLAATFNRQNQHWWITLLEGILGIAAGIVTLVWPGITTIALLSIIAVWALLTGVLEIVGAIRLRREIRGEWSLVLSGIVSLLFAVALMVNPAAGALAIVWIIGIYAIVFGILMIVTGAKVHRMVHV